MIPLRDENPTRNKPVVTILLMVANCVIFGYQFMLPARAQVAFVMSLGSIPELIADDFIQLPALPVHWLTLFSSMFLHGGVMHLAGNMLYLWIFGNNIEDRLGHARFLLFYLAGGFLAALTHILMQPASPVPMIGASGAISAILGAYLLLYPRARVLVLIWFFIFIRFIRVPAFIVLGFWFALQIFNVLLNPGQGIAWYAHIGGFVAGVILIHAAGVKSRRQPRFF